MIPALIVAVSLVACVWLICRAAVERARLHREAATMALDEASEARIRAVEQAVEDLTAAVRDVGNAVAMKGARR